jgi:D-amino-acid dehydrogenase
MASKSTVVVVGGGAIGLCAAYYLSQNGVAVTVVEKGEPGHGCSLHNAGFVCPSHFVPLAAPGVFSQALKWMLNPKSPLYIQPSVDFDLISWAWKFSRACNEHVMWRAIPVLRDLLIDSSNLFDELARLDEQNFEWTKKGLLFLHYTEKGKRSCEHEAELAHEAGVEARLLDEDQIQELQPHIEFRARGGVYFPGDAHLVPSALTKSLTRHLELGGVQVLHDCEVTGFETSGNRIGRVKTNHGDLQADEFVLATGAWTPLLLRSLGVKMALQAGKGYSITIKDPDVKPTIPFILSERRVAVTPFSDSLRYAGTMELAGMSLSISKQRVEAILDAIPLYFRNIERPRASSAEVWSGLRPVTPDGLPYIGRLQRFPNLVVATGHAMLGIALAAVTGKLVSEIVVGKQPSHPLALLNPDRYS